MRSIGILGGGQLSLLLSQKAKALSLKQVYVLSESELDPSAQANSPHITHIKGDPHQAKELKSFLKLVDLVTFESEFFSAAHINRQREGLKDKERPLILPSLKNLSLIQDRLSQKKLLLKYQLKMADFIDSGLKNPDRKSLTLLWERLGPFVLKKRMGGYDGQGTFIIKEKLSHRQKLAPLKGGFIAEKLIPFKRELALLSARNKTGHIIFFPLVESFQENHKCLWIKGPAQHPQLPLLKKQIQAFLNGINYQGLMAFELFDTGGELLINELAPRVHNSGHYSLTALNQDQFTAHLRAIMNLPLKPPRLLKEGGLKAFAMLNLLGEGVSSPKLKSLPGIEVTWYKKNQSRKGRKMGHINTLAESPEKALEKLLQVRHLFEV